MDQAAAQKHQQKRPGMYRIPALEIVCGLLRVPGFDSSVEAAGEKRAAPGEEFHGVNGALVPREAMSLLAVVRIPDSDTAILAGAGKNLSATGERDGQNAFRMAIEIAAYFAGAGVPDKDRLVPTGRGDHGAVRRERGAVHGAFVSRESDSTDAGRHIPDLGRFIGAGGDKTRPGRLEGDGRDRAAVFEFLFANAGGDIPHADQARTVAGRDASAVAVKRCRTH